MVKKTLNFKSLLLFSGATLSWPKQWKHLAFDGQLLHGTVPECTANIAVPSRRLTFLVNVWLHHRPSNCRRLSKVGWFSLLMYCVDGQNIWKKHLGWLKHCNESDRSYLHYITYLQFQDLSSGRITRSWSILDV